MYNLQEIFTSENFSTKPHTKDSQGEEMSLEGTREKSSLREIGYEGV
jgi:hypothetical protein